ncbi:cupin domain-containing protein [Aeromicrobium phragmitis]|uniref:Cupin domain-containing protein n=1 Tax=Aeromicrobium phragmitis TaxID=2478914 RepID=A0A3L8PQ47_9ACTN|nr:cupin domain-containing protein [Aeromicrobium phragmitis]RLV57497.1 cupin domain-containing protein [Aeromicrobium phragmitis]
MRVIGGVVTEAVSEEATYEERLRVPALSVGSYRIAAGGHDPQGPHGEDEVYVVLRGRGRLWTPETTVEVGPESVVFVPAGEEHRFVDIEEDLVVLVVFGPAEHTADGATA